MLRRAGDLGQSSATRGRAGTSHDPTLGKLASRPWECSGLSLPLTALFLFPTRSCDEQWGGLYCDEPEVSLPTQLKDNFNRAPSNQNWLTVNGGKLSTVCGAVASGLALHFSGVRTRPMVPRLPPLEAPHKSLGVFRCLTSQSRFSDTNQRAMDVSRIFQPET